MCQLLNCLKSNNRVPVRSCEGLFLDIANRSGGANCALRDAFKKGRSFFLLSRAHHDKKAFITLRVNIAPFR